MKPAQLLIAAALAGIAAPALAQVEIPWYSIDAGGKRMTGIEQPALSLSGTVAEPSTAAMIGSGGGNNYTITVGIDAAAMLAHCPGDAGGDRTVGFSDITAALSNFGHAVSTPERAGDANADLWVDMQDIVAVLRSFGEVCP